MKKIITILLFLGIVFLSSCGKWNDKIKLSVKNVEFSSGEDSVKITTKGTTWWIDNVSLNDTIYSYYDNENIDLLADSYLIKESSFIIEKLNNTTLFIKLNKNSTGKERILKITLQAGDYFDYINITQLAN